MRRFWCGNYPVGVIQPVTAPGHLWARIRLHGDEADHITLTKGLPVKRKSDTGEVTSGADRADDDIGEVSGELHLEQRFLPDHCLMHENMVLATAEREPRIRVGIRVLDCLSIGYGQAAWSIGICPQGCSPDLCLSAGTHNHVSAMQAHH